MGFSSNERLGTLRVRLVLDQHNKIHYGSDDPVCGTVQLLHTPKSRTEAELFGPLELDINLKGFTLVTNGTNEIGRVDPQIVCSETQPIFRGSFRFEAGKEHTLPFSFPFPDHARAKPSSLMEGYQDSDGQWRFRRRIGDITLEPLPPTCNSLEWESVNRREITVQYELTVSARMPNIDVNIMEPAGPQVVIYEQPRPPAVAATNYTRQAHAFSQSVISQGRHLLPEVEQPHGFRGKMKAVFDQSEQPKYVFSVDSRDFPKHLFVGQPIKFDVRITPDQSQSTTPLIPDVDIKSCHISLIAVTTGKTSDFTHKEITNLRTIKSKDAEISPSGPFTKAHDYTKTMNVGILGSVPSSFAQCEIVREYKLRMELTLSAMGESRRVNRQLAVVVHPPILDDGNTVASGSADAYMQPPPEDGEQLPSYSEAIAESANSG